MCKETFDIVCEEAPGYNQTNVKCSLETPYDLVVAPDGTFLVKVGKYLSMGNRYRYRVATVLTRHGTVLA